MRKLLIVSTILLVVPALASAQAPQPFSLHLGTAVSLPTSPQEFADFYKMGFHGSAGIGYKLSPGVQAVAKIEYHRFQLDAEADPLLAGLNVDGGHNNMWMFGGDLRYAFDMPQAPLQPYVLGGLGLAHISISELSSSNPLATGLNDYQPEAQNKVYFNVGTGVELATGPMWSLFAQVRYVSVQTEGDPSGFIPITLGLKFF